MEDEEHGIRLFWQPPVKEGEDVDPDKIEFLPLGFDEFNGEDAVVNAKRNELESEKLAKLQERKKASEAKLEQLKKELEVVDAEFSLKESIEDLDAVYERLQKEEENRVDQDDMEEEEEDEQEQEQKEEQKEDQEEEQKEQETEDNSISEPTNQLKEIPVEAEEEDVDAEEEDDEEEDDDSAPSSFGTIEDQNPSSNDRKGSSFGNSTFAATSLSFAGSNLVSLVSSDYPKHFMHLFSKNIWNVIHAWTKFQHPLVLFLVKKKFPCWIA